MAPTGSGDFFEKTKFGKKIFFNTLKMRQKCKLKRMVSSGSIIFASVTLPETVNYHNETRNDFLPLLKIFCKLAAVSIIREKKHFKDSMKKVKTILI